MKNQTNETKRAINRQVLTAEYLRECVEYDPDTGIFTWKNRPREHFKTDQAYRTFNTIYAGIQAGYSSTCKRTGYTTVNIQISGKRYVAARVAWLYMTNAWPENHIDHIDGNSTNNRWDNLRDVTASVNSRNRKLAKHNKTGHVGVYLEKHVKGANKWKAQAYIVENGKKKHLSLGYHPTIDDAIAARKAWEDAQGDYTDRHGSTD